MGALEQGNGEETPFGSGGRGAPPGMQGSHAQVVGLRVVRSGHTVRHWPPQLSVPVGQPHAQVAGLKTLSEEHFTHFPVVAQQCSSNGSQQTLSVGFGVPQISAGSRSGWHAEQRPAPCAEALLQAPRSGPAGKTALQKCAHASLPFAWFVSARTRAFFLTSFRAFLRRCARAVPRCCLSASTARTSAPARVPPSRAASPRRDGDAANRRVRLSNRGPSMNSPHMERGAKPLATVGSDEPHRTVRSDTTAALRRQLHGHANPHTLHPNNHVSRGSLGMCSPLAPRIPGRAPGSASPPMPRAGSRYSGRLPAVLASPRPCHRRRRCGPGAASLTTVGRCGLSIGFRA